MSIFLKIFNEGAFYHISEWIAGEQIHSFFNDDIAYESNIEIRGISWQLKQFCPDLDTVICIAKHYYFTGELTDEVKWF